MRVLLIIVYGVGVGLTTHASNLDCLIVGLALTVGAGGLWMGICELYKRNA